MIGEIGGTEEERGRRVRARPHEEAGGRLHRRPHRAPGQAHGPRRRGHLRRQRHRRGEVRRDARGGHHRRARARTCSGSAMKEALAPARSHEAAPPAAGARRAARRRARRSGPRTRRVAAAARPRRKRGEARAPLGVAQRPRPKHRGAQRNMAIERTLSIIKPDGVEKGVIGQVIARFEEAGPEAGRDADGPAVAGRGGGLLRRPPGAPVLRRPREVHDERPGGPHGARGRGRGREEPRDHGRDRPEKAAEGTIRKDFATDIEKNTVHGSDSAENAKIEVRLLLPARSRSTPTSGRRRNVRSR